MPNDYIFVNISFFRALYEMMQNLEKRARKKCFVMNGIKKKESAKNFKMVSDWISEWFFNETLKKVKTDLLNLNVRGYLIQRKKVYESAPRKILINSKPL